MEKADLGPRFLALLIDGIILGVINTILGAVLGQTVGTVLGILVGIGYYAYFLPSNNGQTPGKQIMGVRVVKTDGSGLSMVDAAIRYLGYFVNTFTLFIGWLWVFFDDNRQGFHDKIAKTYVVKA